MKKLSLAIFAKGCVCFLLLLGLIAVCIIGERHINLKGKKIYSGAQEVINISSK